MEQFNSKLYDKYQNLKKRKLNEEDEQNRKRDSVIKSYQLDVEDLIEELKNENDRLRLEIIALQDKCNENQKLMLEESQKVKELSNEVGRLQNLLLQKNDNGDAASPRTPYTGPRTRSRGKGSPKKTPNSQAIPSEMQHKEAAIVPYKSLQQQNVPDCCRNNMNSSGDAMGIGQATCAFQTLMEFLVSMKFSLECEAEGICLLAIHQRSGYTFTLTWIRQNDGGDGKMMYRVSSLGTLERVALDWMKEDLIFSMTMCPVFFERISRVIGRS